MTTAKELPHIYANRHVNGINKRKVGAVRFENNIYYSYFTPICADYNHDGIKYFIVNDYNFTITTRKHQSYLSQALYGKVFYFEKYFNEVKYFIENLQNVESYIAGKKAAEKEKNRLIKVFDKKAVNWLKTELPEIKKIAAQEKKLKQTRINTIHSLLSSYRNLYNLISFLQGTKYNGCKIDALLQKIELEIVIKLRIGLHEETQAHEARKAKTEATRITKWREANVGMVFLSNAKKALDNYLTENKTLFEPEATASWTNGSFEIESFYFRQEASKNFDDLQQTIYSKILRESDKTLLRLKNPDTVETSQNASFPLAEALAALPVIRLSASQNSTFEPKVARLGNYKIDKIENGNVTADCHFVEYPQIEALAHAIGV